MSRFKSTLQTATAALVALLIAPVVALFGLAVLGLAVGATVLMSAAIAFAATRAEQDAPAPEPRVEPAGDPEPGAAAMPA